jgi:hypothetical protein
MTKRFLPILAAALALATSPFASAQPAAYPSQPVKWIVPYVAGGGTDNLARSLAEAMQPSLGQPLIIDNRPGASTNIGVSVMMQAKPDGYTIMQAENAALLFNEHMFAKLPYKPATDFTYIATSPGPGAAAGRPPCPRSCVSQHAAAPEDTAARRPAAANRRASCQVATRWPWVITTSGHTRRPARHRRVLQGALGPRGSDHGRSRMKKKQRVSTVTPARPAMTPSVQKSVARSCRALPRRGAPPSSQKQAARPRRSPARCSA